jgi:aquaporin NIP
VKNLAAEFIGTFALVFAGTGAIVIDETTGGTVTHVGVALTFGLIVLAMIYTVGDISGAHLNPAVSLGFFAARRFSLREAIPYIASQCAGALTASGLLRLLFPQNKMLGTTVPSGPAIQSFVLELILTAILMFVILGVSTGAAEKGITAGIVVGAVIGARSYVCGTDLRRVDESGAIARTGRDIARLPILVDLPACSCDRRLGWCAGLPLCARIRMLLRQNSAPSQRSVVMRVALMMHIRRQIPMLSVNQLNQS